MTKLRAQQRRIHGLDGEDVVERIRAFNFTTTYTFNRETRGAKDDVLLPSMSLEAQAGGAGRSGAKPVGTSLHEDALPTLWDRVAASIRLRPAGPPPVATRNAPSA